MHVLLMLSWWLTLSAPTPQNSQTHSNNSSANCSSVFDHFLELTLKGLKRYGIRKIFTEINKILTEKFSRVNLPKS